MATFYTLNLDVFSRHDWADCKVRSEATDESSAAKDAASSADVSGYDGCEFHIMVADNPDGLDAKVYSIVLRVSYNYNVQSTRTE